MSEGKKKKNLLLWVVVALVALIAFCCFPLTLVGLLGGNTRSSQTSPAQQSEAGGETALDRQIASAEDTLARVKKLNEDNEANPGQSSEVASQASSESESNGNDTSDAQTGESDKTGPGIGDEFTLGDYTYRITGWRAVDQLGSSFMTTKPVSGATFVVVGYEITNNSNETKTARTGDFRLRDAKGRTYRTSSKVETAMVSLDSDNQDFLLSELQPGLKRELRQGFEVPKDAVSGGKLELIVPEKGLMGSEEAVVSLGE